MPIFQRQYTKFILEFQRPIKTPPYTSKGGVLE